MLRNDKDWLKLVLIQIAKPGKEVLEFDLITNGKASVISRSGNVSALNLCVVGEEFGIAIQLFINTNNNLSVFVITAVAGFSVLGLQLPVVRNAM